MNGLKIYFLKLISDNEVHKLKIIHVKIRFKKTFKYKATKNFFIINNLINVYKFIMHLWKPLTHLPRFLSPKNYQANKAALGNSKRKPLCPKNIDHQRQSSGVSSSSRKDQRYTLALKCFPATLQPHRHLSAEGVRDICFVFFSN